MAYISHISSQKHVRIFAGLQRKLDDPSILLRNHLLFYDLYVLLGVRLNVPRSPDFEGFLPLHTVKRRGVSASGHSLYQNGATGRRFSSLEGTTFDEMLPVVFFFFFLPLVLGTVFVNRRWGDSLFNTYPSLDAEKRNGVVSIVSPSALLRTRFLFRH